MPLRNRHVLISGASVAGPMLGWWLVRHGFTPVIVERAARPRDGGYPIDVRGAAVVIADRMGLGASLRAAAIATTAIGFVDAAGRRTATIDTTAPRDGDAHRDLELPRGDLVRILYEATRNDVDYRWDDSIAAIDEDDAGVNVTFERGDRRRFDLVVGADGLHSNVRRLAFGREAEFTRHLGFYVAAATVDPALGEPEQYLQHNEPGRMAGIYNYRGRATGIFVFRHAAQLPFDPRDTTAQKALVRAQFPDAAWQTQALLAQITSAPDFYFDAVSQIRMRGWSRGRVVLVGDAAHAPALLSGQGTSLAMLGAYTLAGELLAANGAHDVAFARYEAHLRRPVRLGQRLVHAGAAHLVPSSRLGIAARDRIVRVVAQLVRLRRLLPPTRAHAPKLPRYEAPVTTG